jgi:small subunit ribosomal protein S13
MALRIAGVNLPDNKRVVIALAYIKGMGISRSNEIIKKSGIDIQKRTKDLAEDEFGKIRALIEKSGFVLEGELDRQVHSNIKRLKEIGTYRGLRHARHLPSRGQRTKTNSRTVRGNVRKTTTSGKKPSAQKT